MEGPTKVRFGFKAPDTAIKTRNSLIAFLLSVAGGLMSNLICQALTKR